MDLNELPSWVTHGAAVALTGIAVAGGFTWREALAKMARLAGARVDAATESAREQAAESHARVDLLDRMSARIDRLEVDASKARADAAEALADRDECRRENRDLRERVATLEALVSSLQARPPAQPGVN